MSKQKRKSTVLNDNNKAEETDATPQKKAKDYDTIISEIKFKFLLRDDETVSEGLQKFVETAELFSDEYPCTDIVANYCKSSPNLAELWSLIEPTGCKLKEIGVALVFHCLEHILTRIRNDLFKLSSVGEAIVQKVLAVHMGQVYNCLRSHNKSKIIKATIDLLIAMVLLSDKSKRAVLARLNFGHVNFPPLFKRRNRQDRRNPRSCMVLLTLALLLDSDDAVINLMVQQKKFLQLVIGGLMYDSKEVVVDTLATLMDKVVKCHGVSKTDKVKLFSEVVLKQICELFQWKGPTGWTSDLEMKKKDTVVEEVDEDGRQLVAEVAYNFLSELCCSYKYGVNFFDRTVGTGKSNKNQILSHFLEWLMNKIDEPQVSDLIISILCACPDQINLVLNTLSPLFSPRWSEKWRKLMGWLARLYSSLPEKLPFLDQADLLRDPNNVVTMAAVFCLPTMKVSAILQQSVKHEDVRVRHKAFQVIMVIALKASGIKKELDRRLCAVIGSNLGETVSDLFTANVLMTLPPLLEIFWCVDQVMQQLSQNAEKAVEVIDLHGHAAVILQVLTLYQNFSPTLISERPKDLAKLIEMVGQVANARPMPEQGDSIRSGQENAVVPQLCLLKLLSEIDAKLLPLGREGILLKLLTFASHCEKYRSVCVELTCKMLQTVEVFSSHGKELCIWIETALKSSTMAGLNSGLKDNHIISFLAKSLSGLISNPAPYVDRILEYTTGLGLGDEESVGTGKHTFVDILAMDLDELDQKLDAFQPLSLQKHSQGLDLPLSPLTLVALDNLESNTAASNCIQTYVSLVLVQLVYTVRTPQILASLVLHSKVTFDKHLTDYITYWQSKKKKPSKVKPLPAETYGQCSNILMRVFFGRCKLEDSADRETVVGQMTKELGLLDAVAKLNVLRQVMFYLSDMSTRAQHETENILNVLASVAEVLIEEIARSERWTKDDTILTAEMSCDQENKEKPCLISPSPTTELEEDKLRYTYSDIFTSLNSGVNQFKEGVLNVLQNPCVNNLIFVKEKRKSTEKESRNSLAVAMAKFMKNVLNKCKDWAWFKCERDVLQNWVSDLMANVMLTGKTQHLSELDTIYLDMLTIVYLILDLALLSKCITQLLKLPVSAFFVRNTENSAEMSEGQQTFQVLCLLLQRWVQLIQEDPSFISANLFPQLGRKSWGKEVATERTNAMRITFSIEESSLQPPSQFAAMFELLPCGGEADFLSVVLFAVSHLPEVARHFKVDSFSELLQRQLDMKRGCLSEQIVSRLLESRADCFVIGGTWIQDIARKVVKKRKWNLISSYLSAFSKFKGQNAEIIEKLKKAAIKYLPTASAESDSKELFLVYQQLSSIVQYKDVEFQQLLASAMKESIKSQDSPDKQSQFELLAVSSNFSQPSKEQMKGSACVVVELALRHLTYLTSSKTTRHTQMETYLLDTLPQLISEMDNRLNSFLLSLWTKLVTNTLRQMYMNSKLLNLLVKLVPLVYSSTSSGNTSTLSALTMFQMCVNHTAFIEVLMAPELIAAKDELVHLLHLLGDLDPSAYEPHLLKVLVGSYTATLSETDQRLLLMMQKCQKDSSKRFECPSVWGKTAVEHHTVSKVLGPSLDKEASVKSILEQLDQQHMQDSILKYPLRRSQQCSSVKHASEFKSKPSCYDPNFLLPLFVQILSPDKLVPLRMFVERGCLSYLLVALSSHDMQSRLLAYQALNDFYQHTEGSRWQERTEVNFVLDLINSSRDKDGQKLSFVLALFLARVVKILLYPADALYVPIFKFLVAKPEIDLHNIPEFYQLFFSSSIQFRQERNWLLSLLCDGLRETSDYWIYQKKLVFKIIMCFYGSSLSDNKSKELILRTLKNACKEKFIAVDLVKKHGLIPWLLTVAKDLPSCPENTNLVCELLHTLWISLTTMRYKSLSKKLPPGNPSSKSGQPPEDKVSAAMVNEDEGGIRPGEETEGGAELRVAGHGDEDSLSGFSAVSVPTSTKVELGLIVKCLIWNLWNASYETLVNLMEIILSLLSTETGSTDMYNSITESGTDVHKLQEPAKTGHCINLSAVETLLLLYHGAYILHLDRIAEKARELLNLKGVSPESLVSRPAVTQPKHRAAKGDRSKAENSVEDGNVDLNKSSREVSEDMPKVETEAMARLTFTQEEQQKLLHLVYTLANLTNTLTFV